ncbi:hypothetical protein GPJ56_008690 [Histomonas meleagridis]|uniref:uncharacterized protein n=1 Tax=Histomonas meleagridis TaxID=135588 RepID=UPI003559C6E3|nr:hypothetical protein GPJ56_008690 [Histomonas meleagridis]KAH0805731.1 hypothetical protein GO595_001370 [Histomonas meleagridis]
MFVKDFLKGQKILIVMLWSSELSKLESSFIDPCFIDQSSEPGRTECIKTAVEHFGIEIKVVLNYYDAIKELTKQTTPGLCDYYAVWVICGPPYPILPIQKNPHTDPNLVGQFIEVLILFWENGGSIVFWADGDPLYYQVNLFLQTARFKELGNKCSELRIGGEHKGGKILFGDKTGELSKPQSFNRNPKVFKDYQRFPLAHNLGKIFEGITISYVQNENNLKPFIPFTRDSSGGISSLFYPSNVTFGYGDIIIDCGFTKCFTEINKDGTFKYIQNIAGWTARPEIHQLTDRNIKPKDWRPKAINYIIQENEIWYGFTKIAKHRLFAIDCSGSVKDNEFYHSELRKILELEYEIGDKIFLWSDKIWEKTRDQMNNFMDQKEGKNGTYSNLIVDIAVKAGVEYRDHLIIVTDGEVPMETVQKGDKKMEKKKIKFKHVTTYLINGNDGNNVNLSVGAAYSRGCPNETYLIKEPNVKLKIFALMQEDLDTLNAIGMITKYKQFKEKFNMLEKAIQAKTIGTFGDQKLSDDLQLLKQRIEVSGIPENKQETFHKKWKVLDRMASGAIKNAFTIDTIAAAKSSTSN